MNNPVLDTLKKHLQETEISQNAIAKAMGISAAALSQYLKGKYPGDVSTLETKVAQYLKLSTRREAAPRAEIGFVETSVVKQVCEILNNCHVDCRLGIITGASGLGKTTGVQHYLASHADVVVIYARPSITLKSLLQELADKVGVEGRGSADNVFMRIVARLRGSKRMLVIDEAEHLTARVLDVIRRFVDTEFAGIGVVLVGLPRLWHTLCSNRGDYEYIYNRSRWNNEVCALGDQDVKAFVAAGLPEYGNLWRVFADESMRKTRILLNLIEYVAELAELNQIPISAELIHEAAKRTMR